MACEIVSGGAQGWTERGLWITPWVVFGWRRGWSLDGGVARLFSLGGHLQLEELAACAWSHRERGDRRRQALTCEPPREAHDAAKRDRMTQSLVRGSGLMNGRPNLLETSRPS
eukprot:6194546-Pleurochrysis_carterae.AAC.3